MTTDESPEPYRSPCLPLIVIAALELAVAILIGIACVVRR